MPRRDVDPLEIIKNDIEQKFHMACVEMATDMTYKIQSLYESVIQSFYNDYTPRVYQRTGSTYQASDKWDDPFGITPVEGGFEAGIHVGPENIPGQPYRADKAWVFPRTFNEGIHGFYKWEWSRWRQKIWEKQNKKYVMSKARKQKLKNWLLKTTQSAPYKYRGEVTKMIVKAPKSKVNTYKSVWKDTEYYNEFDQSEGEWKEVDLRYNRFGSAKPITEMNKKFKLLTQRRAMDAMFKSYLKKYWD